MNITKNITKRIAAFTLVMLMVITFVSCGETNSPNSTSASESSSAIETTAAPEASIVGLWKYKLDLGKVMDMKKVMDSDTEENDDDIDDSFAPMMEKLYNAFEGVSIDMLMEFTDDNSFKMEADKKAVKSTMNKIKNNIIELLPEIYKSIGYNLDSYLKNMDSSKEILAEQLMSSLDEDSFTPESSSGTYRRKGNKLYLTTDDTEDTSDYCVIELTDKTFTITEIVGSDLNISEYKDFLLPMKFTRVE